MRRHRRQVASHNVVSLGIRGSGAQSGDRGAQTRRLVAPEARGEAHHHRREEDDGRGVISYLLEDERLTFLRDSLSWVGTAADRGQVTELFVASGRRRSRYASQRLPPLAWARPRRST